CITGEAQCPYATTTFAQDYGSVSKPTQVDQYDGSGNLWSSKMSILTPPNSGTPYTSLETQSWVYIYDGTAKSGYTCPSTHCKRSLVTHSYDNYNGTSWVAGYGNMTQETSWGDYDLNGDERTVSYSFVPNTTAYIIGKPAAESTYAGTSTGGTL